MYQDFFDRHRSLRVLVGLAIITLTIYVFGQIWSVLVIFGDIILLFLLSWIIAFILEPLASFLQRWRLHRLVAITIVYVALVVVVSGAMVLIAPTIATEIKSMATQLSVVLAPSNLPTLTRNATELLQHLGLKPSDARNVVEQALRQLPAAAQNLSNSAVSIATGFATSVLTIIFDATLVAIISFYMMADGARLVDALVRRLPPTWSPYFLLFQQHVQDIFSGFFRAQLIIAGMYGFGTWLIVTLMGLPGGLLAAILAAILMLLPFLGAFLSIVPPMLLLALQPAGGNLLVQAGIMILALGALQHVVLNVIAPKVFGHHTGVPTLVTFGAMLFGAKQGGVWGAFFAVPIVGVGWAMFEVFFERFVRPSSLFQPASGEGSDSTGGEATAFVVGPREPGSEPQRDNTCRSTMPSLPDEPDTSASQREAVSPGSSGPRTSS